MLKEFLSLFLKSPCLLCQRSGDKYLCQFCQKQLEQCQLKDCSEFWQGDLPLFAWGIYQGKLKGAIAAFKYDGHRQLGDLLGNYLATSWLDLSPHARQKMAVVPIPLHPDKLITRGFNQTDLLAKTFCQLTGYQFLGQALERTRDTQPMFGLNAQERQQNLKKAFTLGKSFLPSPKRHKPVLILDDIYTTGTTVKEAAQTLQEAGIEVKGVIAIATGKKREKVLIK